MDSIIIYLVFLVIAYLFDYWTAEIFAKRNWKAFRQYEQNKSLVWHREQELATQNKGFMRGFNMSQAFTILFSSLLIGYICKIYFNVSLLSGMKVFLLAQIITNFIGTLFNTLAIYKYKEVK